MIVADARERRPYAREEDLVCAYRAGLCLQWRWQVTGSMHAETSRSRRELADTATEASVHQRPAAPNRCHGVQGARCPVLLASARSSIRPSQCRTPLTG